MSEGVIDELLAALKLATRELNAIRARDGAPLLVSYTWNGVPMVTKSCTEGWWDELTERCFKAIELAERERS